MRTKQVLPLMLVVALAGCAPMRLRLRRPTKSPPTPARS